VLSSASSSKVLLRYGLLVLLLASALAYSCGSANKEQPPLPTITPQSGTPAAAPDAQTLVQPGYVVDQTLPLSLDGSPSGQIVVISHAAAPRSDGQTPTGQAPQTCPTNETLQGAPSPCAFRIEVFGYDPASGWTSNYLLQQTQSGGAGMAQSVAAQTFAAGSGIDGLIVTFVLCADQACPVDQHIVYGMRDGQVVTIFNSRDSTVRIEGQTAIIDERTYKAGEQACCPSGRQIATIGLNPATGTLDVLDTKKTAP
jgi:hypothetical protein